MDINYKAKLLGDFVTKYQHSQDPTIQAFIKEHNLGLPLGYALDAKMITLTDDVMGEYFIETTYDDLCEFFMCDPSIIYESVDQMLPSLE